MALRDLKVLSDTDNVNKVQDNIDRALRPILGCPLLDGVLLENIRLTFNENIVEHKLGRKLRGYFVVSKNDDAIIWDNQATNRQADRTLILVSDSEVTISIWCF